MIRGARRNNIDVVIAAGAGASTADPFIEANRIINEGVTLSQAGSQDEAIAKFMSAGSQPRCFDSSTTSAPRTRRRRTTTRRSRPQQVDRDQADRRGHNGLANVYNAQRKFDDRGQQEGHGIGVGGCARPAARKRHTTRV
jgi:hypothetical protein